MKPCLGPVKIYSKLGKENAKELDNEYKDCVVCEPSNCFFLAV